MDQPDLLISRPESALAMRLDGYPTAVAGLYLGGYAHGAVALEQALPPRTAILRKPFEPETLLATV
jgi:hypothetical protein